MIHHVYANQSNIWDWLSAIGIQRLLADLPVREHFCDGPFAEETLGALEKLTQEDFVILGGGGLFMDYFAPFWQRFKVLAPTFRYCIWGVGCCEHKRSPSALSEELMCEIVGNSEFCVVRDELTHSRLAKCELPPPVPCTAISAAGPRGSAEKRVLYVENYSRVVSSLESFARASGRSYRQINNIIPRGNAAALEKCLDLYSSAEFVVTSRLHGCIISVAMGRPVLAISGDRKIESFMAAAGLSEWVCGVEEIENLHSRIEALSTQSAPTAFVSRARANHKFIAEKVREASLISAEQV
jgi:polysaccharide pyruvyl transferase WcaK-like protein